MGWNARQTLPLASRTPRARGAWRAARAGFKQFLRPRRRPDASRHGSRAGQGALDEALSYAKERIAFGQPISKYQAIQTKLADMSTEIEAARLITYKAALEKDAGKNFSLTAAQAKLKTGRVAVKASEEAVQIHGGYGYIEEYLLPRLPRPKIPPSVRAPTSAAYGDARSLGASALAQRLGLYA